MCVGHTDTSLLWVMHIIRQRDDDIFAYRGPEDADRATAFILVHLSFYMTPHLSRESYFFFILSGAGDESQTLQSLLSFLTVLYSEWLWGGAGELSGCDSNWNLHYLPGLSCPSECEPEQQDSPSFLLSVIRMMNEDRLRLKYQLLIWMQAKTLHAFILKCSSEAFLQCKPDKEKSVSPAVVPHEKCVRCKEANVN